MAGEIPMRAVSTLLLLLVAAARTVAQTPAGETRAGTPRIPPVDRSAATTAQLEVMGDPARQLNVTATIAQHPDLAKAWLPLARHILGANTLPARDREILILRIGWLCQAEYEWGHHAALGRRSGLTDDQIARIAKGPDAPGWSAHDRALLTAVDELHRDARIADATWSALAGTYNTQQLIDVVFTVGQYNLVSMALRSFGVEREPGVEGFPAR
jgi:alkylhydroperoxidase family enzyme